MRSFVILASISSLSFLLMLDSKNDENVLEFDLIFNNKDFSYNGVLHICCQPDKDYKVVEATKFV